MNLQNIETIVLAMVGADAYAGLSTDASKTADFALLHQCVNLARDEIKANAYIPNILKLDSITTVANQTAYDLATDFDTVKKVRYKTSSSITDLIQVYTENLVDALSGDELDTAGTPTMYRIFGESSDVAQIELYNTPGSSGDYIYVEYVPTFSALSTSTEEDIILKKYPNAVIKLASAYAYQILKKDMVNFDRYYMLGMQECTAINARELMQNSHYKDNPPMSIRNARMSRSTK